MKDLKKIMIVVGGVVMLYSWIGVQNFQQREYIMPSSPLFYLGAILLVGSFFLSRST
jgi:hypothetical protein